MILSDPKERFSGKASYYTRYRPSYPEAFYNFLETDLGLQPSHIVADIGAGTGLSSKWFLQNGNMVYAVEPNMEMRLVVERFYNHYPDLYIINGQAEDTNIPDNSVDFIITGQAFHWFEFEETKKEFKRILKPGGLVLIVWNERLTESSVFLQHFEHLLLKYSSEYREVDHRNIGEDTIKEFFGENGYGYQEFLNCQMFNWDGLVGRLFSTSYIPSEDHPEYLQMIKDLSRLFRNYAIYGQVKFDYITRVYYGRLA